MSVVRRARRVEDAGQQPRPVPVAHPHPLAAAAYLPDAIPVDVVVGLADALRRGHRAGE